MPGTVIPRPAHHNCSFSLLRFSCLVLRATMLCRSLPPQPPSLRLFPARNPLGLLHQDTNTLTRSPLTLLSFACSFDRLSDTMHQDLHDFSSRFSLITGDTCSGGDVY
ncbi:hypothetical protein E2C01_090974 [Portunus trituberculatus]|uniref:Uncharacterized protein n=1 Tax=Portunus trituberculatus TaxID=210409 RepID=A0A5B7JLT6_PORTR|nr:hypothetical protein [Portunus trituberculatus]